jgi:hypothetical protein
VKVKKEKTKNKNVVRQTPSAFALLFSCKYILTTTGKLADTVVAAAEASSSKQCKELE